MTKQTLPGTTERRLAALDAVGTPEAPGPGLVSKTQMPALKAMLRREAGYWRKSAAAAGLSYSERVLSRVVMVATLIGAAGEQEAESLLRRVPELRDASGTQLQALAWWQHFLYPGEEWAGPLLPDLLA